jgi:CheY-like chemotaxis protein
MNTPNIVGDILLVDDNPGDVRLTKELLRDAGLNPTYHVVHAGSDAVDFLLQQGEYSDAPRPDIILLDLFLGRMNGDDVIAEVADDIDNIPVVVLSGSHGFDAIQLENVKEEVDACLEKPIEPDEASDLVQLLDKD